MRRSATWRAPCLAIALSLAGVLGCDSETVVVDAATEPGQDSGRPDATAPDDGGPLPPPCIGVRPDPSAWLAEPGPRRPPEPDGGAEDPDAGAACAPATCIGAPAPVWALSDFQPQSCGDGAVYGLDVFRGHVTVVALLAGW